MTTYSVKLKQLVSFEEFCVLKFRMLMYEKPSVPQFKSES